MNPVPAGADAAAPRLELLTREGCHLCTAAREVVAAVADDVGLAWQETMIDGDPALTARYGEEVPVVLVDGVPRDFWQIDPVRLRSVLLRAMGGTGA
jgi:hypothetical protein